MEFGIQEATLVSIFVESILYGLYVDDEELIC